VRASSSPKRGRGSCVNRPGEPGDLVVVRINPNAPLLLKGIEPGSPEARRSTPNGCGGVNQWRRGHRATSRRSQSIRVVGYVKPRRIRGASTRHRIPEIRSTAWCHVGGGRPVVPRECVRSGRVVPTWPELLASVTKRLRVANADKMCLPGPANAQITPRCARCPAWIRSPS